MKKIPLTQNKFATVDDIDFGYLNQWKWYYRAKGYAVRMSRKLESRTNSGNQKTIHMHREVLARVIGHDDFCQCDHINMDKLDNRRCNLRSATQSQNGANSNSRTQNYKGVSKQSKNRWQANIRVNGVTHYLGLFNKPINAAKAYNKSALEYFGEFARLNDV